MIESPYMSIIDVSRRFYYKLSAKMLALSSPLLENTLPLHFCMLVKWILKTVFNNEVNNFKSLRESVTFIN